MKSITKNKEVLIVYVFNPFANFQLKKDKLVNFIMFYPLNLEF